MGAMERNAVPGVFTFSTGKAPQLTTLEERLALLESAGIEAVWLADFDRIRDQSPAEFVRLTLANMGAVGVACGFNFRFGSHAAGDTVLLRNLCAEQAMECRVIPPVMLEGVTVSSTEIRNRLKIGDMDGVARLMGRPWAVTGTVAHGRAVGGKLLSSPTMNLPLSRSRLLPPFGVYFTRCLIDGIVYPAITNLGVRPTFGESEVLSETHLLDVTGDFYGKQVQVQFLVFHREERKFETPEALSMTIAKDIACARRYFQASPCNLPDSAMEVSR